MQIRITPLTELELPAARDFNSRMASCAPFFLPESLPSHGAENGAIEPAIRWTHYAALQGSDVRGGFLLMEQPAVVAGQACTVYNSQSMLSEGIRDRKYGIVSVQMLKYIERNKEPAFMVGMGSAQAALPRLLAGAGWTVRAIPFLYRVQNARRFLREMPILQESSVRRSAATAASSTGAGWLGIQVLQWRSRISSGQSRGLELTPVTAWGEWANEIWKQFEPECSFAVVRDRPTLDLLYPLAGGRVNACVVHEESCPVGWAAWLCTPMHKNKYFGNLRVATILDCLATPAYVGAVAGLIADHIAKSQADLVISNQAHGHWIRAFRRAGFLSAPSNYLLATSRKLSDAIRVAGGEERVHLTRGDGDGRIQL